MSLKEKMTALADAVRAKAKLTETLTIDAMTQAINGFVIGKANTETLTVTPSKSVQTFSSSNLGENTYYSTVTVNAIPSEYITTTDATAAAANILEGKTAYINGKKVTGSMTNHGAYRVKVKSNEEGVSVDAPGFYSGIAIEVESPTVKTLTVTPSEQKQTFTANDHIVENGAEYYGTVTVEPIPSEYVKTADATVTASDLLEGVTAYGANGKVTGRIRNYGDWEEEFDNTRSILTPNVADGYFKSIKVTVTPKQLTVTPGSKVQVFNVEDEDEFNAFYTQVTVQPIPDDYITTDDATAEAGDILTGKTAYVKGVKISGEMPSKTAETYTPGTADITITDGVYLAGKQTIKGDAALTSENIKTGVSIFDVAGTFTADADAEASDIAKDKIAYVKGVKIIGTASEGAELYKCAEVLGPHIISYISVTGAGISDCNGNYSDSGMSKNGQPVYSYTGASGTTWYIFFIASEWEGDYWVLSDDLNLGYGYGAHYCGSQLSGSWYGGEAGGEEAGQATVVLDHRAVNAGQEKTWSGYKLVAANNGYELASELTTDLTYASGASSPYVNNCIMPKVGGIYNSDCTAEVFDVQFAKTDDALTLTAEEAFSTVRLDAGGNSDISGVRYSTDGKTWKTYTSGLTLTLYKVGDFVKFENTKSTLSVNMTSYHTLNFVLTGKIAATGELKSMLNYADSWHYGCFSDLFRNQNALTTAPDISCDTLGAAALMDTFGGCKNLKKARVSLNTLLPREDDGTYNGVHSLFLNCTSLSVIEVDFTSWDGFDTLVGWLEGVSPRGVFIKSSALPAEYGEYRIPHNWQVVNK